MLSDTDSMNIFNACSLIECTTNDEDKNAVNLKFVVSCKNVGGLFPTHFKDTIILFHSFWKEGAFFPNFS